MKLGKVTLYKDRDPHWQELHRKYFGVEPIIPEPSETIKGFKIGVKF